MQTLRINKQNAIWCACNSDDHVVVAYPDSNGFMDNGPDIVLTTRCETPSFLARLKYVLGLTCCPTHLSIILNKENAVDLEWMAQFLQGKTE